MSPTRLADVVCPQCAQPFRLDWNDSWIRTEDGADVYHPATLVIRGCPSGGVYDVTISCPHCDYEEPL